MSTNPFPYRHRLAVADQAGWLIAVLTRGMREYRGMLEAQHEISSLTHSDPRSIVTELCRVDAALEQLDIEGHTHASP